MLDIAAAAEVLNHCKIALGVESCAAAANLVVRQKAEEMGHWDTSFSLLRSLHPSGVVRVLVSVSNCWKRVRRESARQIGTARVGWDTRRPNLTSLVRVSSQRALSDKGCICGPDSSDPNALPKNGPSYILGSERRTRLCWVLAKVGRPTLGFSSTFRRSLLFAPRDDLITDVIRPWKHTY